MPLELTQLAAGLPMAAPFAMAGGISVLREGRRRTALNEAMHELRRPLQAISLTAPPAPGKAAAFESSLQMAAAAVDRLDREINGGPAPEAIKAIPFGELVESTVKRWEATASLDDRAMSLKCVVRDSEVIGNRAEIAQAVDNLISNAVVHGIGEVAIEARTVGRLARLVVVNRRRARGAGSRRTTHVLRSRISGRAHHGHGLRVVRRTAARHGGIFHLRDRGEVCEAVLDLPLRGAPG
jgi:signal transduction histidine kinase